MSVTLLTTIDEIQRDISGFTTSNEWSASSPENLDSSSLIPELTENENEGRYICNNSDCPSEEKFPKSEKSSGNSEDVTTIEMAHNEKLQDTDVCVLLPPSGEPLINVSPEISNLKLMVNRNPLFPYDQDIEFITEPVDLKIVVTERERDKNDDDDVLSEMKTLADKYEELKNKQKNIESHLGLIGVKKIGYKLFANMVVIDILGKHEYERIREEKRDVKRRIVALNESLKKDDNLWPKFNKRNTFKKIENSLTFLKRYNI